MSFVFRCVMVLLVFSFIVYVMKAIARLSFNLRGTIRDVSKLRDQVGGRPESSAEMIRCASCGSFISTRDAITLSSGSKAMTFCSQDCAKVYLTR